MEEENQELPECPECLIIVEQSELDMFGGYCESCFEEMAEDNPQ